MREVPKFFKDALETIGGQNPFGEPKLRVVWSPDCRKESGVGKGSWKYPDPSDPLQPLKCWMLEVWVPVTFFNMSPDEWPETLGAYPTRGRYVSKTPLGITNPDGTIEYLELTQGTLDSIRQQKFYDQEFSNLNSADRLARLNEAQVASEKAAQDRAMKRNQDSFDYYLAHKEQMDNDDNRVFSFPKQYEVVTSKGKMPVKI